MADQDEDETIDQQADSEDSAPVGVSSLSLDPAPASAAAPAMNPIVQQHLQQLAAAQDQARHNAMLTGLARAGASLSAGLAHSNQPVNEAPFNAMAAEDQAPVTNLQNQQKAESLDLKNQADQISVQKQAAEQDPDSPQSKQFRATFKANFPTIAAAYGDKFDLLTADDSANVFKVAETKAKLDENLETHRLNSQLQQEKFRDRQSAVAEKAGLKATADQQKAYVKFGNDSESARGNDAVKQAMVGLKNSDAAMAIINSVGTDYNKLDQQQYNTLTSEIGKIATGGVGTEASAHDQRAQTLVSKAAAFWQGVSGRPTGAQLGEFIKQNKEYLDSLNEINHRYVDSYQAGKYLAARGQFNDDQRAEYEERHPGVMKNIRTKNYTQPDPNEPTQPTPSQPNDHAARAADILAKRQAARAQQSQPAAPQPASTSSPIGAAAPASAPNGYQGPVGYAHGGTVPGLPKVPGNNPVNDTVPIMATPKEEVLPLSVTQSKAPSMAAYLHMKRRGYK